MFFYYTSINAFSNYNPSDSVKPLPQLNKQFNVVAHIVIGEDSVPVSDPITIANAVQGLNTLFAPIGASFKLCDTDYINNYQFDTVGSWEERAELVHQFWLTNRINIYVISQFVGPLAGEAGNADLGGVNYLKDPVGIVIEAGGLGALGHEMGHYFSLPHTFNNATSKNQFGPTDELVNGSNCATAGDGVCDTPADPYAYPGGSSYIKNCIFIYTGKDANGQYYDPDVENIMSYYQCGCGRFSWGQYNKMANYYLSNPIEW